MPMPARHHHLLVLEADLEYRRALAIAALKEGLSVTEAEDVATAWHEALRRRPDGVICGDEGEPLCRAIRVASDAPVVICLQNEPVAASADPEPWWDLVILRSLDPVDVIWHVTDLLSRRR